SPDLLIDHPVDAEMAPKRGQIGGGTGRYRGVRSRKLVAGTSEEPPGTELHASRKPGCALLLVVSILRLADDKRRVLHAKVQPVAVARLRIAQAGSCRVAIEDGEQQ